LPEKNASVVVCRSRIQGNATVEDSNLVAAVTPTESPNENISMNLGITLAAEE
jgi:hypothetical protein